jgi:hypothetical protein
MSFRYLVFIMFVITSLPPAKAGAALNCEGCHPSLAEVLPASHKTYHDTNACLTCHKPSGNAMTLGKKVHTVHLEKLGKMDCALCHQAGSAGKVSLTTGEQADLTAMKGLADTFSSWDDSGFLDHAHKERGFYCTDCHQNYLSGDDPADRCVACHGNYDTMAKRQSSYEKNPHKSHLPDLRCTVCHKGHAEFKSFCSSCHPFGYTWTYKKR